MLWKTWWVVIDGHQYVWDVGTFICIWGCMWVLQSILNEKQQTFYCTVRYLEFTDAAGNLFCIFRNRSLGHDYTPFLKSKVWLRRNAVHGTPAELWKESGTADARLMINIPKIKCLISQSLAIVELGTLSLWLLRSSLEVCGITNASVITMLCRTLWSPTAVSAHSEY